MRGTPIQTDQYSWRSPLVGPIAITGSAIEQRCKRCGGDRCPSHDEVARQPRSASHANCIEAPHLAGQFILARQDPGYEAQHPGIAKPDRGRSGGRARTVTRRREVTALRSTPQLPTRVAERARSSSRPPRIKCPDETCVQRRTEWRWRDETDHFGALPRARQLRVALIQANRLWHIDRRNPYLLGVRRIPFSKA